jgi:hypothetical protein
MKLTHDQISAAVQREWVARQSWAAKHPELLALLKSYRDSPNPEQRALADALTGSDRAHTDLSVELIYLILRHLKKAEKGVRGRKRDMTEEQARANLRERGGEDPTPTNLAREIARLKGKDEDYANHVRINLHKRMRLDAWRATEEGCE